MSHHLNLHTTNGVIAEQPGVGYTLGAGATPPADNVVGWAPGALWIGTDGTVYQNDGTKAAADFNPTNVGTPSDAVVNVTTSTLTITEALHNNRIMTLNLAAGIAITLPTAKAGLRFRFIVGTTFTGAASIKSVSGADIMIGHALMGNNSDNTVVDWQALAASTYDTIDLFGTSNSTGGIAGQEIEIIGLAANLWFVSMRGDAAGTEATPFADSVS